MAEPRREGKEAQPGGEPPPAALPEDDAGRGLEPSSRAPRRGAWPLPGPLPLTFNPGCWRAFLPPLLVRWAGRPVGRAGVEAACAERRGRSTAGPHLAERKGPNGTEGSLSSLGESGHLSFMSPWGRLEDLAGSVS